MPRCAGEEEFEDEAAGQIKDEGRGTQVTQALTVRIKFLAATVAVLEKRGRVDIGWAGWTPGPGGGQPV